MPEKGGVLSTYGFVRAILKPWLKVWFRWTIEGLENIPEKGPAILAFNHISYLDPFSAGYAVDQAKRTPRFLAKSELFQDKRIAWILRGAGQIEVRRGTHDAPMALDTAIEALQRGEIIVVFPEGTVTTDPDLRPMRPKTGVARLALQTGTPLIPCAVWGSQNIWPKGYGHNWRPRQDVLVRIGEPMTIPEGLDLAAVSQLVMDEIGLLVASLRTVVPDRRRPSKKRAA